MGVRPVRREGEQPMMNRDDWPAPARGLVLTHFLTVRDVAVSRRFYADVFGGEVVLEENPAIVKVANSWVIMNPGGGPTPDKPDVTLVPPGPGDADTVSAFMNVRVADIAAFYADAIANGARFLTEPVDRKAELRCYLRDPDGYLIEVGQATGMLEGIFADRPGEADG
jgi:catechol 2,3-dioxygenase-like lactoylglutathione lyase family enzyme